MKNIKEIIKIGIILINFALVYTNYAYLLKKHNERKKKIMEADENLEPKKVFNLTALSINSFKNHDYFYLSKEIRQNNKRIAHKKKDNITPKYISYLKWQIKKFHYPTFSNKTFDAVKDPKISVIVTVYNQQKYILQIYNCISVQSLKDIERIFMDDNSSDKSSYIIKKLMKNDKRIVYYKNDENKGQFFSRSKAALLAKGEYLCIIDADDLILDNILEKGYNMAKKNNLDIVHYHFIRGNKNKNRLVKCDLRGIHRYPETKNAYFNSTDHFLWDKIIKREVFIKSIEYMDPKYRKERFPIHNDDTACYGVFRVAKSYGVLEQVGYFWNNAVTNTTSTRFKKSYFINDLFRSIFTTMKYYYDQSDDDYFEKRMGAYNFFIIRINHIYRSKIQYLTTGFDYIIELINFFLKSEFYTQYEKYLIKEFKVLVLSQKLKIEKKSNNTNNTK